MQFTQGHALIIGVGADLSSTVNDAQAVADFLTNPDTCAYPPEQVTLLTEEKANRDGVLAALDTLATQTDKNATVIIYYSGHGLAIDNYIPTYFLLTHGFDLAPDKLAQTAILDQEFAERLRAIPAQKVLVLFDCCHAGGFDFTQLKAPMTKAPMPPHAVETLGKGRGYAFIASSHTKERSIAAKPYSVFTYALLEALSGATLAKQNGFVYLMDINNYLAKQVPRYAARLRPNYQQNPQTSIENADNFAVAYYAGGEVKPKGIDLPELQSNEDTPAPTTPTIHVGDGAVAIGDRAISLGKGAVYAEQDVYGPIITGSVSGGFNWGGQQTTLGNNATLSGNVVGGNNQMGLTAQDAETLFAHIIPLIAREAPAGQQQAATQAITQLQNEIKKGAHARDPIMAQLLGKLLEVVPDATKEVGKLFALPILQGIAGPATDAVLRAITLIP